MAVISRQKSGSIFLPPVALGQPEENQDKGGEDCHSCYAYHVSLHADSSAGNRRADPFLSSVRRFQAEKLIEQLILYILLSLATNPAKPRLIATERSKLLRCVSLGS